MSFNIVSFLLLLFYTNITLPTKCYVLKDKYSNSKCEIVATNNGEVEKKWVN